MAAIRTLLRKYWILVVIVLWVIAWANRDRLAGGDEVATATVAETAAPSAGTPPPAPVPGPDSSSAAAKAANEKTVAAAPPASKSDAPVRGTAPAAPAEATPPPAQPVASAAETRGVAKPAEAELQPAQPEASDTEGRGETGANPAAAVLVQTREAYRSRGPRGAAEALARGLADLPADAPERADLLGELGNFYISAGDIPRALAAYDRALMALSVEARGPMISRLAPVYDRFHPMGRSHLEQFR